MKLFKVTTDTNEYAVYAESKLDAECLVIKRDFYDRYDDALPDLMDVEEITNSCVIEVIGREEPKSMTVQEWQEKRSN